MKFSLPLNNRHHKNRLLMLATRNILIASAVLILLGSVSAHIVQAAGLEQQQQSAPLHGGNCLLCHGKSNFTGTLGDGVKVNLTLDNEAVKNNIHLRVGSCAICHKDFDGYPHPNTKGVTCSNCHVNNSINPEFNVTLPFDNSRTLVASTNDRCTVCHQVEYTSASSGMHAKIASSGNQSAPYCSDCHGSHTVQHVTKDNSSQMCAKCHEATFNTFEASVHGAALSAKSSTDSMTCVDCHGSHTIDGPGDPNFRKTVVAICLKCHQDKIMMNRYNLPGDSFGTSLDNYHAVKVDIVGQGELAIAPNMPVCTDCHGIHSIMAGSNPGSTVSAANLLGTCQKCHAGEANFTVGGKAHLSASSGAIINVGFLQKFFGTFTPISVGLVALFIVLDARKQWSERKNHNGKGL